jgi:translation initiation factor 3 subunit M
LNNSYNSLRPESSLRAPTLLSLLTTLSKFTDLSILPLSPAQLSIACESWSNSSAEKVNFLVSAAEIYRSTGDFATAYDVLLLALRYESRADVVEKATVVAVLDEKRFNVDQLSENSSLSGEAKELVGLLSDQDAVAALGRAEEWTGKHSSWIQAKGASCPFPADIRYPSIHTCSDSA